MAILSDSYEPVLDSRSISIHLSEHASLSHGSKTSRRSIGYRLGPRLERSGCGSVRYCGQSPQPIPPSRRDRCAAGRNSRKVTELGMGVEEGGRAMIPVTSHRIRNVNDEGSLTVHPDMDREQAPRNAGGWLVVSEVR